MYGDKKSVIIDPSIFKKLAEQQPRQKVRHPSNRKHNSLATALHPLNHTPDVLKLIAEGKLPANIKRWTYGTATIMCVPPVNDRGWFIEISRPDRVITQQEAQEIGVMFIPKGLRISGRCDSIPDISGYFHAVLESEPPNAPEQPPNEPVVPEV